MEIVPEPHRRLVIVDRLRGLVLVLMVLDHVRDFFNREAFLFVAEDVSRTTPLIFATRWVTHLCAPTFVLLAGVSVGLQQDAGKTGWQLSRFLLARGCWLVFLELTIVSMMFDFAWPLFFLQVIWAIGVSMILLAGAVWLPRQAVLIIGLAIVIGGQGAALLVARDASSGSWLWTLSMAPGVLPSVPSFVAYPVLPWFGIMAIGYGAVSVVLAPEGVRTRRLIALGLGLIAAFVVLRGLNGYGNPVPWSAQPRSLFTVLSFLNVAKYPPSLDYVLVTLGIAITLAPLLVRLRGPVADMLDAFGRTPLFTYLLHVPLVHLLALLGGVACGLPASLFTSFIADSSRLAKAGWGISIGATYGVWIVVVLALWPAARWFAAVKARRRAWWLSFV